MKIEADFSNRVKSDEEIAAEVLDKLKYGTEPRRVSGTLILTFDGVAVLGQPASWVRDKQWQYQPDPPEATFSCPWVISGESRVNGIRIVLDNGTTVGDSYLTTGTIALTPGAEIEIRGHGFEL